eukprot:TRINITY_DN7487_c2_g1_i1.p1 TRINITY_DN7487_c2_g1~~TRINITY_DN7487_c2_g1_i1.p1  ORF type:complete len:118 (+),score=13.58 TRINITY_DN7487_c2_g1_i1:83-436(+)
MSLICNTCKREIVTYYSYGMTKQDLKDTDADIRNCGKIPLLDAAPFVPFICPSCNNSLVGVCFDLIYIQFIYSLLIILVLFFCYKIDIIDVVDTNDIVDAIDIIDFVNISVIDIDAI